MRTRKVTFHKVGFLSKIWIVVIVQSLSHVCLFVISRTAARQASVHHYLSDFAQAHVHWVGDIIQSSHPLSPLSLNIS